MSGNNLGGSSSNSSSSNNKQQQPLQTSLSSQQIDLDPSTSNDSLLALHSSHKVTNLKAASLPPQNDISSSSTANQKRLMSLHQQPNHQRQHQKPNHQHRSTKSQEPSIEVAAPSNGQANCGQPFSMDRLIVTPPNIPMSQVRRHLSRLPKDRQEAAAINKSDEIPPPPHGDDGGNDHHNVEHFDQGAVLDTLARWQQELSSASEKPSKEEQLSANGHIHHLNHHENELDIEPEHNSSLPIVEPQLYHQNHPNHQNHHQQHQATNARRFITRSTRSASRQSAGHSSPPPSGATSTAGANYHHCSDSSDSSPSPTRRRNQQQQQQQASIDQQSSANGNSSAYETAATSVMTHGPAATAAPAPSIPVPSQQQKSSASIPLVPAATTNFEAEVVPKTVHPLDKLVALRRHPSPAPASSDKKKEEVRELRQRYSSPSSPRTIAVAGVTASNRRLSSSELSPKLSQSGFNSEPIASVATVRHQSRACSQPTDTPPTQRRQNLVAVGSGLTMKQNLSELHFTGAAGGGSATAAAANTSPKPLAECTLRMRPRSSTMCNDKILPGGEDGNISSKPSDILTNIQLSPVERNKRTPEASPRRLGDRDKSSKRKSNLNRSLTEEATKDGDDLSNATSAAANRRRRRRELGQARPLLPADDDVLRDLLVQSPMKSSCSESTTTTNTSRSESQRSMSQLAATMRHPEVPVRTMTAILPCPRPLHAGSSRGQKLNERTKTELAEIKKIAEMASATTTAAIQDKSPMSPILRRKSTDDQQMIAAPLGHWQTSPPAPNQIVSILKKKEHAFGECNSSNSSNASPVTFSSSVMDPPLATGRSKRQGILKKRSSLDESRYYSRSHSPDERSILIKSARRNSLEESGTGLQTAAGQSHGHGHGHGHGHSHGHGHGILKQSSYDSSKSDGCPSATECQPHSILKKKDSLSTPSDGGCHKHVSISQAVILAAAELAANDGCSATGGGGGGSEDIDEHEIRPILKQESTSSEEAVRPPKPILKKKSFGEADEHEIRPILKSSRKSSREEFDLNLTLGQSQDNGDIQRPILKTESPSKRRSLGSNLHELDLKTTSSSSSSSMLKRRTRSLERHDGGSPVMDLAAALDAIATSQTPVDFVTTPASMSVAERVKHMEMLSTTTTTTPTSRSVGGINSIWDTPSTRNPNAHEAGGGPRLLKPSVLRRDLQRERYKTQPVTSEEKSFFKANSTPFDISASSAFKPTKPLDIRLTSTSAAQQPLISPITGQPLSHVPAPLLLSSSAHSAGAAAGAAGSGVAAATSFRLARSSTQPLQSPRVVHLASQGQGQAGAGAGAGGNKPSAQSTLLRQHSINDSFSLSEQLTLSLGNDSENIFEMSGLDDDSAIQSLGDEAAQARATATTTTTTLSNQSSTPTTSGLTRSNSVRARANMFQQLQQQEQTRNRRDSHGGGGGSGEPQQQQQQRSTIANRQALRQSTPPPASNTQGSPTQDDPSTPNTTHDAEFEPSSLSLAERLAFFTSLCDTGSGGGGGFGSCRTSSYSKSPPMDRTPRSSTTASSASVTPTPMECSPLLQEDHPIQHYQPSSLTLESINEHNSQNSSNHFHALSRSATEPTAVLCDQQQSDPPMLPGAVSSVTKIKIRTVGKLIMPDTFLGDRNNNNNATINHHDSNKTCLGRLQTLEELKISMGVRTIGKIKSPFIEQQQQQQQQHSKLLTNGGCSSNQSDSDSGKENCASNEQKDKASPQKVSEMRRKISRLVQQQQQSQAQPVQRRHTTEITTSSNNSNNNRSPLVDERYAKYFGCKESLKTTTVLKTESKLPSTPATPSPQEQQQQQQQKPQAEATNEYVRLPIVSVGKRRELLKRTRPVSFESSICSPTNGAGNVIGSGGSFSPTAMPSPKRAHSPGNRIKAMISCYDDIIVTPAELNAAGKEFHRLCEEASVG